MTENISIFIAFGAGLLSFLSPCVLPLIPSYLCITGGAPADADGKSRPRVIAGTVSFIAGFSAVFITLSVLLAVTFSLMGELSRWIHIISGAVVIVLGLNIIFDFLKILNYEKRLHLTGRPRGITGAFVAGAAFGAGWTPCVGPVLAGILLLAAQSGGIPKAVLYLAFYSAGLGLPFLLASIFFSAFLKASAKIRAALPLIRKISGALLVVIGLLMITGRYQALNALAAQWQSKRFAEKAADAKAAAPAPAITNTGESAESGGLNQPADGVPANVIRAFGAAGLPVFAKSIEPPDFTLPLLDGTKQTLSALKGKAVFLNFWATWCGPCRSEMPSMEAVYRRLNSRGFEILAVNLGENPAQVAAFMKENKLSFPAALDKTGAAGAQYGAQAIPTTYILDRRGRAISRVVGAIDWNRPEIIAALESLLESE